MLSFNVTYSQAQHMYLAVREISDLSLLVNSAVSIFAEFLLHHNQVQSRSVAPDSITLE